MNTRTPRTSRPFALLALLAAAGIAGLAAPAQASIVSPTPNAFGGGREYAQTSPPVRYDGIFPDWEEVACVITSLGEPVNPSPPGPGTMHSGPAAFSMTFSRNGGPPVPVPQSMMLDEMVWMQTAVGGGTPGISEDDVEIFSMLAVFDEDGIGPIMIRESPTLASRGHITVQDAGNGLALILSSFGIYTELSADGGATWIPASGPIQMELVPAPGASALLGLGGLVAMRRRRGRMAG